MINMKKRVIKMVDMKLFGNINKKGFVRIKENKKILDILKEDAMGMASERKLEIVQIGGPLGQFVAGEQLTKQLVDYLDNLDMPTMMFLNDNFCPVDFTKFLLQYVKREMRVISEDLEILSNLIEELSSGKTRKYTYEELLREVREVTANTIVTKVKRNIKYLMDKYEAVFLEHFESKKCAAGVCSRLFSAQCVNACPAEINIPGYIALMYQGKDEEAYRLMRQNNPLSLICGKICARPCEDRCRRGEIEKTVGVRALKHYAATITLSKDEFIEEKLPKNGKKIGVIGAGPAGLSASYYLAKTGYEVDIYEKYPVVGGMLAVGVPSYRLAQASIDREVKLIENLGVSIYTNTEVGKDIGFQEFKEKYDSIVLATGCHLPNIFSAHISNLESAIDFLKEVKLYERKKVGKKVVVIGGGDVAMDAARTALRLGAEKVDLVSLESYLQMPANDEEKEEAQKEGIEFHNGFGTKYIQEDENIAQGITLKKCMELYDLNNRFNPIYDEDDTVDLQCDHIILAIGQRSDISYLESAVQVDVKGRIQFGKKQDTSLEGVYVAGDIGGPGSAIKAIAEGKKAAEEIDRYLEGKGLFIGDKIELPVFQSHYSIWDAERNTEKIDLFTEGCHSAFQENKTVFTEDKAREEALRCMRCDRNSKQ
jgi:NADH-quinone oxidoreductase subunit F